VPVRDSFTCVSLGTSALEAVPRGSMVGLMLQALCSVPEVSITTCPKASWLQVLPLLSGLEHGCCSPFALPGPWCSGFCFHTRPMVTVMKIRFSFAGSCGNPDFCLVMVVPHSVFILCCQDHNVVLKLPVISGISSAGDDKYGRKVILFSACRMPPSHQLDHVKLLG